jgi:hypothetical protein
MVTKYGIISDAHRSRPDEVAHAIEYFADKNIDAVVLNGDIIGDQSGASDVHYFGGLVSFLGLTKLDAYIMPGSHETSKLSGIKFGENSKNVRFVDEVLKVEKEDHDIIFMPGSDWRAGQATIRGYALERGDFETGEYGPLRKINMNDLTDYVKRPEETVLFSHIPRKFDNVDTGVDRAYFAESLIGRGLVPGIVLEIMIKQEVRGASREQLDQIARLKGYEFKNENRGNEDLKEILEDLKIKKNITGHFHESAHRAHDAECNPVEEGKTTDELFWNASYSDDAKFGILTVKGPKVKYENIRLARF